MHAFANPARFLRIARPLTPVLLLSGLAVTAAALAARASALPGAVFTFLCLASGSIWGRPAWGTWWVWDCRLTSMLVLLFPVAPPDELN